MVQLALKIPDNDLSADAVSDEGRGGFRPHQPALIPLGAGYYAQFLDSEGKILSEHDLSPYGSPLSLWHDAAQRLHETLLLLRKKYSSPVEYHKSGNLYELRIKNSLFPITSLCAHPRISDYLHQACLQFCRFSPVYFISRTGRFFICSAEDPLISMVHSWLHRPPIRLQSGFFSSHDVSHNEDIHLHIERTGASPLMAHPIL